MEDRVNSVPELSASSGGGSSGAKEGSDRWKGRAEQALGFGRDRVAGSLGRFASAFREVGKQIEGENASFAHYAEMVADRIERASTYVRDHEPGELFEDVERFGKQHPGLLLGGAALFGFVASRLVKSSLGVARESTRDVPETPFEH